MHPSTHIVKELANQRIEQLRSETTPRPQRPRRRLRLAFRARRVSQRRHPASEQLG
jgi:hypothetical protein